MDDTDLWTLRWLVQEHGWGTFMRGVATMLREQAERTQDRGQRRDLDATYRTITSWTVSSDVAESLTTSPGSEVWMPTARTELHLKHRPRLFKEVIGQNEAVRLLQGMLSENRVPHSLLFTGGSGVGKTTMARILSGKLGCSAQDCEEVNCALVEEPKATIESIARRMDYAPLLGDVRVWILDEVGAFSRSRFAQEALLKMLEDTPEHVWFFLLTTDPGKLIRPVLTRCTEIRLRVLSPQDLVRVVRASLVREGRDDVSDAVVDKVVEAAQGSARQAQVVLGKVLTFGTEEDMLAEIESSGAREQAKTLSQVLLNERCTWKQVMEALEGHSEDPESVRRMVLAYMAAVLKGGGPKGNRAARVINLFRDSVTDSGLAGLMVNCWELVNTKE